MIQLLALRAFIPVWARAISLSDKLSEKTWKLLVALQCIIFLLSAGGFRESRLSSPAAPDVTVTRVPPQVDSRPRLPSDLERPANASRRRPRSLARAAGKKSRGKSRRNSAASVAARRLYILKREYTRRTRRHLVTSYHRPSTAAVLMPLQMDRVGAFDFAETSTALTAQPLFMVESLDWREPSSVFSSMGRHHITSPKVNALSDFGRFIEPARIITVQLPQSEVGDYKKALLFWVSLLGLIVSPLSAASTAVVAWISVHRGRADELLKQAQLEKMRLEMEQLRVELEQTRLETERHQSRIVIAAG